MEAVAGLHPTLIKQIYNDSPNLIDPKITQRLHLHDHLLSILTKNPKIEEEWRKKHPKLNKIVDTRLYHCKGCNLYCDRDFSAARNIMYNGLSLFIKGFEHKKSTRHFKNK